MKQHLLYITFIFFLFSCYKKNNLFQSYKSVKGHQWHYNEPIDFEFEFHDTDTAKYDIDINLRHTGSFPYKNCWIWVHFTYPSGEKLSHRKELELCNNLGEWYGKGLNNIFDVRNTILKQANFHEKGKYKISIEQNMRDNPLHEVLDVGLRIQKSPYSN